MVFTHSHSVTFLSVNFIVAALSSWQSMKCSPTHWRCQTVFSLWIPSWRVIFSLLQGCQVLPFYLCARISKCCWYLFFQLGALLQQQPLLLGAPQQIVAIPILWRKFVTDGLQKWESIDVNRCSLDSESCVWGPVGGKWCPESVRKTPFVCCAF